MEIFIAILGPLGLVLFALLIFGLVAADRFGCLTIVSILGIALLAVALLALGVFAWTAS